MKRLSFFSILFLALALGACSSKTEIESDMGLDHAPEPGFWAIMIRAKREKVAP